MLEVRRRKNEPISAFLHRFSTRVKQSGILREARKRRYHSRPVNRAKRRANAIYRAERKKEFENLRKTSR